MKFEINQPTIPEMATYEEDADCDVTRPPLSPVVEMPPEYPDDEESSTLLPCAICNRTFSPSALQRHSKVCEKLQSKKRNKFDSTKQRQGLDILPLGLNSKDNKKEDKKKKSRWREKHQEFLRTIRAAKGSPDEVGDNCGGNPQKIIPSDYVQCPYCERHFGPKAADRHINWCSEQKSRLPRSHTSEDTEAIHRLKTRTKYTPPKPGQNEWRAPRKKDVISSIPPPNVGPNLTPPGRLISPPPPVHRQISPPPNVRPTPIQRHTSPPPASPPKKTSSTLPPGPTGSHRYSTASLGRAAGRHFASMMQSVTGCNPGYGVSSGYGSHSLYGSSSNHGHATFNRSASLRLPKRRSGTQGRMARHRDLASDMLASVTLGGKAKREEPEGDEASNMTPFYDRSHSNKLEKERSNERRKKYSDLSKTQIGGVNLLNIVDRQDHFHQILNSSEEDEKLPLERVKSKREALDMEILKLTQQLRIGPESSSKKYEKKNLPDESQPNKPNSEVGSTQNSVSNLVIASSDSEEFDCNLEERFLKSSMSLSGDEEVVDVAPTRPRSVHFVDERVESDYFDADENKSSSENSNLQSWSTDSLTTWLSSNDRKDQREKKTEILLFNSRPIKSKKSKESVREILRKRREMVDQNEHDSRRRVQSVDERMGSQIRSRSQSRDSKATARLRGGSRYEESPMRKSASTGNCSENNAIHRHFSLPLSASSTNIWQIDERAVISRRDYAHIKSLIGTKDHLKNHAFHTRKRLILKPKKSEAPTRPTTRLDNVPYDPFSAAELQFQDLLGPSKPGEGLRSEMMGSTSSLKHIEASRRISPDRDPFPSRSKPRGSNLIGGASLSLCSLGLDSFDFASSIRSSAGDDSSELESLENSPRELRSPDDAINDVVSRFSTSRITDPFPPETSNGIYKQRGTTEHPSHSESSLYRHSRSPSLTSQSANSPIDENHKRKHPEGGSTSCQKSSSPQGSFRFDSPERKSLVKEMSPSPKSVLRLSSGLKKHENDIENTYVSSYRGWTNHSEVPGSPKTYSRYLSGRSQRDSEINSQAYSSAYETIKALRATMGDEKKISVDSSEEKNQRTSSSSSTDSSMAALSSPASSSPMRKEAKEDPSPSSISSLPTFCYECGNKYPVVMAKFCCHCGARRLIIGQ